MLVKVTFEVEVPDVDYPDGLDETILDATLKFAQTSHLQKVVHLIAADNPIYGQIISWHNIWADKIGKSFDTVKVEKV